MPTMVALPITEPAKTRRLTEFASDVAVLAGKDAELRELVDDLHRDLLQLKGDDDGRPR